jgi:tetratricopeptide (TPR) repeat protein
MQPAPSDPQAALARAEKYLAADPTNPRLLVQAIDAALAIGNIADARRHADAAITARPGDPYMQHRHASVLLAEGRADEAAAIFESLWTQHRDPVVGYNLALARFRQGRLDEALSSLVPVGDATPTYALALAMRVLHHQDKLDEAREIAQRQMAQCRESAECLAVASLVCFDLDDIAQAEELAKASLARGPRMLEALVVSGYAALARTDLAAAQGFFGEALRLNPQDVRSIAGKGMAALLAGDAPTAQLLLEQATASAADNRDMLQALGWAYLMSQDLVGAERVFATLSRLSGSHEAARGGLAVTRALQGRRDEAAKAIAQLKADDPAARMAKAILDGDAQALAALRGLASQGLRRR